MQSTKLHCANPQYPALLREITNPPAHLFVSGPLPNIPLVAIVGSRLPTDYGRQVTYRLASELAAVLGSAQEQPALLAHQEAHHRIQTHVQQEAGEGAKLVPFKGEKLGYKDVDEQRLNKQVVGG